MEPEGFAFAFDITSKTSHLIALSEMSTPSLNPHLIETPIVKLHNGRNLHPCNLVVTYEIVVLDHADVKQFRQVKKWLVKVKIVVYD